MADSISWWLWPNLLSLDAPLIAVIWNLLFARSVGVYERPVAVLTLALWVWIIYASDRVLDTLVPPSRDVEPARHRFYRQYRAPIVPLLVAASIAALWLTFDQLRFRLLLDGIPLGVVMAGYFGVVHLGPRRARERWPKELAVAILFGAGVLLPVIANLHTPTGLAAPFILFVAILWINAAAIERWEMEPARAHQRSRFVRRGLRGHPGISSLLTAIVSGALIVCGKGAHRRLYAAIALSALALAMLARRDRVLSRDALRVLADAALLSPLCFLFVQ